MGNGGHPSFGKLDIDLGWDDISETETPHSGVRRSDVPSQAKHDDATRIGNSALEAAKAGVEGDPRSSGTLDDPRLDQLRALYAGGDTDAAVALAAKISGSTPPPAPGRSPSIKPRLDAGRYDDIQDEASPADQEGGTAIFATGTGAALTQVASLSGVPHIAMGMAEIQQLPLDPRAGFLISMIDGASSVPDLCDLAGMPEDEVVSVLSDLARYKVIAFE